MTKLDKMAKEANDYYFDHIGESNPLFLGEYQHGYIAGFKAARVMAWAMVEEQEYGHIYNMGDEQI